MYSPPGCFCFFLPYMKILYSFRAYESVWWVLTLLLLKVEYNSRDFHWKISALSSQVGHCGSNRCNHFCTHGIFQSLPSMWVFPSSGLPEHFNHVSLQNLDHDSSLAPVSSLDYKRWLCIFHFPFPRTWHNPSMKHLSDECFFEWKKNESHINCVYSNVTTWEPVIFRFSQISLYSIHLKKISLYNKHSDDISASAKKRI